MEMSIVQKTRKRKIERLYWIVVILTEDWDKDYSISKLSEKDLTRFILISKPVYHKCYERKVRYATFSFF